MVDIYLFSISILGRRELMDVDPTVSRCAIGTPTQLSLGTGGYKTLYATVHQALIVKSSGTLV